MTTVKKVLVLFVTVVLSFSSVGCGVAENLSKNCKGSDIEMGCNTVFGYRDNDQDSSIKSINERVSALEVASAQALINISSNTSSILSMQALIATLPTGSNITSLSNRIALLESQIGTPVTGLQATITANTAAILSLQSNHSVTKLIDPCGNGPGYDEIFLRTNTGKIIASFSDNASGLNTRFSELTVGGPYFTTDGTGCTFTVTMVAGVLTVVSNPATVEY